MKLLDTFRLIGFGFTILPLIPFMIFTINDNKEAMFICFYITLFGFIVTLICNKVEYGSILGEYFRRKEKE